MIRFTLKVGIAGTAVYYLKQEGVWRDSSESLKVYDKINKAINPYIKELKNQIPIELPEIPPNEEIYETAQVCWNKGVLSSFGFLSELPELISNWTIKGFNNLYENPEIRKLFENSTNTDTSVGVPK